VTAIHQVVPYLHGPGDATADQIYALQTVFRGWGLQSDIYALESDSGLGDRWYPFDELGKRGSYGSDELLLYHYVSGSDLTQRVRDLRMQLIVFFHNITPPEYVTPFHSGLGAALSRGREEIELLSDYPAIAPSVFSQRELLALGFSDVYVTPLLIDFDRLRSSAESPAGRSVVDHFEDEGMTWLAVGRIAPNKRCEDILKAFSYYHHIIDSKSRLLFVGGWRHFEAYQFNLRRMVERFCIDDVVEWCGWVAYDEGFAAYYKVASLLVSMSEHEGFCLPLVEAMVFDLPIVAYAGAAIPDTLGNAGVLIHRKRYEMIAGLADALNTDRALREKLLGEQRRRLKDYARDRVIADLRAVLSRYLPALA